MPIEINELVIRAVAGGGQKEEEEFTGCGGGAALKADEKQHIIEAAVKEVLRILQEERER